jgi:hypothetical protein
MEMHKDSFIGIGVVYLDGLRRQNNIETVQDVLKQPKLFDDDKYRRLVEFCLSIKKR